MKRKIKDEGERRRARRCMSIRKKVVGSLVRPRLHVFRSLKHIYAQVIDDDSGKTLAAASSQSKDLQAQLKGLKKSEQAEKVGRKVAEVSLAKGIAAVVFDRNGRPFHGRIAAVAKGARDGGLTF